MGMTVLHSLIEIFREMHWLVVLRRNRHTLRVEKRSSITRRLALTIDQTSRFLELLLQQLLSFLNMLQEGYE